MQVPNKRILLTLLVMGVAMFAANGSTAADAATLCGAAPTSQPFLPWDDSASYVLAPDGDFSSGLAGWTLSGAAGLVAGPEPWMVSDPSQSQSLELPAGSSATSPSMCIAANDPDLRFFAVNAGDPASLLNVSVSVTTPAGLSMTLPVGVISSDGAWAPSPRVWIGVNGLALGGPVQAQFTFTPSGSGDWEIDDLYVDPWGRT